MEESGGGHDCVPETQSAKRRPTLLLHGSDIMRMAPSIFGDFHPKAVYPRWFVLAATWTPRAMVAMEMTPSTQVSSVVWRTVNPKEFTMSGFWFLNRQAVNK
jgi:hypothetical protein